MNSIRQASLRSVLILPFLLLLVLPAQVEAFQLLSNSGTVAKESKPAVRAMLTTHWSISGTKSVGATFAEAPSKDVDVLLAYSLNQFRYGDVDKGIQITQEINQRFSDNLDGWLLTTWYQTLTDEFDQALISMDSLVKKMEQAKLDEPRKKIVYRRLGRLVGYLEGPVRNSVNEDLLEMTTGQILKGLKDPLKTTFQQARDEVKKKYATMQTEHQTAQAAELAKAKIVDDQKIERIKQENQRLEKSKSQIEPQKATVQSQADSELSQLRRQADSALYQLNQANASVAAIERDLWSLYAQLNFNRRQGFFDFFLIDQIRQAEFALSQARNNAFVQGSQVASIQNQIVGTSRNYSAQLSRIDAEIKQVRTSIRRNDGKLNRLAKGPRIADGKISGRRNRRTSLRTYDELSLDLYRKELLAAAQ